MTRYQMSKKYEDREYDRVNIRNNNKSTHRIRNKEKRGKNSGRTTTWNNKR